MPNWLSTSRRVSPAAGSPVQDSGHRPLRPEQSRSAELKTRASILCPLRLCVLPSSCVCTCHRTTTKSSRFMIALATVVIAARSAWGSVRSHGDAPVESSAAAAAGSRAKTACCSVNRRARISDFDAVRRPAQRAGGRRRDCGSRRHAESASRSCSAIARAASTNCGSFSNTSACSGVDVVSRFAVHTSRDIASKASIDGGGDVRRQNV